VSDWQLSQGTVDFRNEERRAANRGPQESVPGSWDDIPERRVMSASTQWAWLVGGKIVAVDESPDEDGWNPNNTMVTLHVKFPKPRTALNYSEQIPNTVGCKLQVWQDEEGNGAGELVLTETESLKEAS